MDICSHLKARGYPDWSLDRASKLVPDIPRQDLIRETTKKAISAINNFFFDIQSSIYENY